MKERYHIAATVIFLGALSFYFTGAAFLFLVFAFISYLIYENTEPGDRRFILTVLVAGFLLRVAVALALHAFSYVRGYEGSTSGDDLLFTVRGWAIVHRWEGKPDDWIQALTGLSEHGMNPFTFLLAAFYKIFGFHPMEVKIINCMIGTMIGWITYPIGREMFGNRSGKISMLIATFYPSLIRWSIANLKDPMTAFSFLVCVYILVCAVKTRIAVWKYLLLFFFMAVLFLFPHRFYFVLVAAGAALAASLRLFALLGRIVSKKALAVMVVIALLAAAFYIFYVKPEPLIQLIYKCEDKQYTISRSDYAGYHLYPNTFMGSLCKGKVPPLEFFEVICLNTAYFMLTPFPWQMTSRERLAAYPQILAWYLILFLSVFGFAMLSFKKPRVASLVGTLLAVGIVFSALAEGNIGAAFRHRDVFTPFFIILAAAVLEDLFYGDAEVSSPSMGAKA